MTPPPPCLWVLFTSVQAYGDIVFWDKLSHQLDNRAKTCKIDALSKDASSSILTWTGRNKVSELFVCKNSYLAIILVWLP